MILIISSPQILFISFPIMFHKDKNLNDLELIFKKFINENELEKAWTIASLIEEK